MCRGGLTLKAEARKMFSKYRVENFIMSSRTYLYLDSTEDREKLIAEIRRVRASVLRVIDIVPEADWYTPRYHNWSLGAMLGHLNMMDNLTLLLIQAALLNLRPPVPMRLVNPLNHWMARVYQNRVVESSRRSAIKNEKRIADFILRLPVDQFSKMVYYSPFEQYTTVEKALQDYYVYHWQEHLNTLMTVEGIQQPPERSDSA
jgi:hypothetical protein